MNEQPTNLTHNDLMQRDAFIAQKRAQESRQRNMIMIAAIVAILIVVTGAFQIVKNHRSTIVANQLKAAQESQRAQEQAATDAVLKAERDFQASYAGKLQSWETIMGNRNPIKGWRVRRREEILSEISAKQTEINMIFNAMRSITTQKNYSYSDSRGVKGSGTVTSYNSEEMAQLRQQLNKAENDLFLLQSELRRDDYFQGKIAGHEL